MGAERGRTWDWLTALAGLVLAISPFLPWFYANGETSNAWHSLRAIDIFLFVAGCVAMSVPLLALRRDTPREPQQ